MNMANIHPTATDRQMRLRQLAVQYPESKPLELQRLLQQEFGGKSLNRGQLYAIVNEERKKAKKGRRSHLMSVKAITAQPGEASAPVKPVPFTLGRRSDDIPEELQVLLRETRSAIFGSRRVFDGAAVQTFVDTLRVMKENGYDQAIFSEVDVELRQPERFHSMQFNTPPAEVLEEKPSESTPAE